MNNNRAQLNRAICSNKNSEDTISLSGEEFHHLCNVKRLSVGDSLEIFLEQTKELLECRIETLSKSQAELRIIKEIPKNPSLPLCLLLGMPKPKIADFVVEKAQELGIRELCFFQAERTQGSLGGATLEKKLSRWQGIARSAFKQSGAGELTSVSFRGSFEGLVGSSKIALLPNASENFLELLLNSDNLANVFGDLTPPPTQAKTSLEKQSIPADLILMVGPEGGLTENEVEKAKKAGFETASLGVNILRVETAIILACGTYSLYLQSQ